MSTSVDSEAPIGLDTEITKPFRFGTVDLDVEGVVGSYKFGDSLRSLLPAPKIAFGGFAQETNTQLKFIVAQSESEDPDNKPHTKMYVFDTSTLHSDLYRQLQQTGQSHTLLSAGYLDLTLGERNAITRGELSQYSDSLEKDFQLDREKSDEYKKEVLVKKLGSHFSAR